MLGGAVSFQHAPSADTDLLSKTQVRLRKLSSPFNFKFSLRKFAPLLSRADFLTQKLDSHNAPSSRNFRTFYRRQDLHSLQETLRHHSQDDYLPSFDESSRQDLQSLKSFFNLPAEAQPKTDSEHQRGSGVKTIALDSKTKFGQANTARTQPDTQSKFSSADASLGSPNAEKKPGNTFAVSRVKDALPAKHRGSRKLSRGFDVLDELMSSQGRSSRAVLESLQSAVANENGDIPFLLPRERDSLKVRPENRVSPSLSKKVSTSEFAEGKGGIMSQLLSDFRRIDTWQPSDETMADTARTSSTFASSIEKALSPSTVAIASSTTSSTLANSRNASVLPQSIPTSPSDIYSVRDSEVAKPSLRGQEVLWALQKAAIEKAKLKQRARKVSGKASKSREDALLHDSGEWRNVKPFVVKAEWALQIEDLEQRIENLKNPMICND